MSVWDEVVGQHDVCRILKDAARADSQSMTHAWLITGPPGSGRSTAARAFAAALQCENSGGQDSGETCEPGCGHCHACTTVMAHTHPDVTEVATDKVIITIKEVSELVAVAQQAPTVGRWKIIIVEDADRMVERTSNLLLKSIEEPPAQTVWLLCAPSAQDVLTTIRSRCRHINLRIPAYEDVAGVVARRTGVDYEKALEVAHIGQAHIGVAQYLAKSPQAVDERARMLERITTIRSVTDAVFVAEELVKNVQQEAKARTEQLQKQEYDELLQTMGYKEGDRLPPQVRSQIKNLEQDHKRRTTRIQRDLLDRMLLDVLSLYRDVYTLQVGARCELINVNLQSLISYLAQHSSPQTTVMRMDVITQARKQLNTNVAHTLLMEAMLIALRPQADE